MTSEPYITKYFSSQLGTETTSLCLSMYISPGVFMYSISTDGYKNIREICHVEITHMTSSAYDLTEKISQLISNYLLQQKKFERVNICILNQSFTISPESFFTQEKTRDLLEFALGRQQNKSMFTHKISSGKLLFAIEQSLVSYLEKIFPNASIRHAGAVSLSLFFSHHTLNTSNLYLHVSADFIELAAKQNNDLLFYNVFQYSGSEDILYYLLFMMEQFDLNPLHVKLTVAGEKSLTDDLIKTLKRYIKNISMSAHHSEIKMAGELLSLPHHYYFPLLNQHLCEL